MKKIFISVYGIYKNEENVIERFLNSVKDADEIILCDTGSSDNTNNLIESFTLNNPNVNLKKFSIYVSPWRFDDARNTALSLVSTEADICISVDMDEYFPAGWREILTNAYQEDISLYSHKFKTFWLNGETEHLHQRIHSRFGYTWKLPVHEILEYEGDEKVKYISNFYIFHRPEEKESRKNYINLLKQSVLERKDIWKSWSFLSNAYFSEGKINEALEALDTAFKIKDCDKSFLYVQKYNIYKSIDDNDNAYLNLIMAIFYMPFRRELYFEKAKFLSERGKNLEAYFTLLEAEKKTNKIIDYHYNESAWNENFVNLKKEILSLAKKEAVIYE